MPDNANICSKIAVIGGDLRMFYAAEAFAARGIETALCGFDRYGGNPEWATRCLSLESALSGTSLVVLPIPAGNVYMPYSRYNYTLGEIVSFADSNALFVGGMLDMTLFAGKKAVDYAVREDFKIINAIPTAEGALAIAAEEMDITLSGAVAVVVGFGMIAKPLTFRLKALGAEVCVIARNPRDRAICRSEGIKAYGFGDTAEIFAGADVIFNTVPERVIDKNALAAMSQSGVLVELASKPYGFDTDEAEGLGVKAVIASGLPGKYYPRSAGRAVFETVANICAEKGVVI